MINLQKWIQLNEFFFYLIIGTIATLIDWVIFGICSSKFQFHYEAALVTGYCTAAIFHYCANKLVTFKCKSKALEKQLPLYILSVGISLSANMIILAALVNFLPLTNMIARIATTLIMIVPNYLLHKHITFSKKIFA